MKRAADDADEVLQKFGLRVAELRTGLGWTQEHFAAKAGWSFTYVRRIEAGRANLSIRSLVELGRMLLVDAQALLAAPAQRRKRKPGRPKLRPDDA